MILQPGKKKKFIDKKHAVSFTLGSRSQHDPVLLAGGSENVLLPERTSHHVCSYNFLYFGILMCYIKCSMLLLLLLNAMNE